RCPASRTPHRACTGHAGHRRIDTLPLSHGGWSLWYIVGVNGSYEGDTSDFVNDQQWTAAAPNAESERLTFEGLDTAVSAPIDRVCSLSAGPLTARLVL